MALDGAVLKDDLLNSSAVIDNLCELIHDSDGIVFEVLLVIACTIYFTLRHGKTLQQRRLAREAQRFDVPSSLQPSGSPSPLWQTSVSSAAVVAEREAVDFRVSRPLCGSFEHDGRRETWWPERHRSGSGPSPCSGVSAPVTQSKPLMGLVKNWSLRKEFGFIGPDDGGCAIFCPRGELNDGLESLERGMRVRFTKLVDVTSGRFQAVNVSVIANDEIVRTISSMDSQQVRRRQLRSGASRGDGLAECPTDRQLTRQFGALISESRREKQWQVTVGLLQEMQEQHLKPDLKHYNETIAACAKGGQWSKALDLLKDMRERGVDPDVISYNSSIDACARSGQSDKVPNLIAEISSRGLKPNLITFSSAIGACARVGQWGKALYLLNSLPAHGLQPDVITYSVTIGACAKSGRWEQAIGLLDQLKRQGLQPNVINYNATSDACARGGQWQRSLELLEEMPTKGVLPDLISYNAAIDACFKCDQWELSLQLLDDLKRKSLQPSSNTYTSTIVACGRAGAWTESLRLLENMRQENIPPESVHYHGAIEGCTKSCQVDESLALLEEMCARGMRPNTTALGSTAAACAKSGRWEEAVWLVQTMQQRGTQASVIPYSVSIGACAKGGGWAAAVSLLQQMQDHGLWPGAADFSSTANVCLRGGQFELAVAIHKEMRRQGHHSVSAGYCGAISRSHVMDQCWWQAPESWEDKRDNGYRRARSFESSEVAFYDSSIRSSARACHGDKAVRLLRQMRQKGFKPDLGLYHEAAVACASREDWDRMVQIVQEMVRLNLSVDVIYDTCANVCASVGKCKRLPDIVKAVQSRLSQREET
eukprot:TRINITY_DN37526_c0_g1_i1.p1 TRINITY_DN37526_c0_g1~~TRINITY_DN37526_c0_g1_i1.p1  ORF type:complete len:846 (-),score=104.12 TRINITY_DN37526_c0_g1_i1:31-2499(-)